MKTLILFSIFLWTNVFAFAQTPIWESDKFAISDLWEAPMRSSISLKISPKKDFRDQCEDIEFYVSEYLQTGIIDSRYVMPSVFEVFRKEPLERRQLSNVYAEFKIDENINRNGKIHYEINGALKSISKLPYYHQVKSKQSVYANELIVAEIIHAQGVERSITSFSRELGFRDEPIIVNFNPDKGAYFLVEMRDVACDLLAGRVVLKMAPERADIELIKEEAEKITFFYQERLLPEIKHVLKEKEERLGDFLFLRKKGVKLGYRAGGAFEDELETRDRNLVELALDEFAEKLFNDDLTPKAPLRNDSIIVKNKITVNNILITLKVAP